MVTTGRETGWNCAVTGEPVREADLVTVLANGNLVVTIVRGWLVRNRSGRLGVAVPDGDRLFHAFPHGWFDDDGNLVLDGEYIREVILSPVVAPWGGELQVGDVVVPANPMDFFTAPGVWTMVPEFAVVTGFTELEDSMEVTVRLVSSGAVHVGSPGMFMVLAPGCPV